MTSRAHARSGPAHGAEVRPRTSVAGLASLVVSLSVVGLLGGDSSAAGGSAGEAATAPDPSISSSDPSDAARAMHASPTLAATAMPTPDEAAPLSAAPSDVPEPTAAAEVITGQGEQLITLLNQHRRDHDLPAVVADDALTASATACARRSSDAARLSLCGHDMLWTGPADASPQEILATWLASDEHQRALTYPSSQKAGAVVVSRGGIAIAALTIDY